MENNPAEARVMRGIIAREAKRARDERQAAIAAKPKVAPSPAGWSRKPDPERKASMLEKEAARRVELNRHAWALRHPKIAAAERSLRKERAQMLERWDHKRHGTAETHEHHARLQEGPLARLCLSGGIDAVQLASAVDIAGVHGRIGADVAVATASMETRIDSTRIDHGGFFEKLGQVRRERGYTRWRAEVNGPIAAVLDMIVGDAVGFTIVARRYRMHNRKAKQLLIDALDLWPRIMSEVCREISEADLLAAQAGILA